MDALYKTKQRDLILSYFLEHKTQHTTADDILDYFRRAQNPIGKSTVYRYLNILVNQGIVKKYSIEEGDCACYQYCEECRNYNNIFHLKCSKCGKVIHIECNTLVKLNDDIFKRFNFKVDSSKTILYGLCENCSEK